MSKNDNVKFKYASSRNITFHGEIDSGFTREKWDDLNDRAKAEALDEALNNLVEIWAVEE